MILRIKVIGTKNDRKKERKKERKKDVHTHIQGKKEKNTR